VMNHEAKTFKKAFACRRDDYSTGITLRYIVPIETVDSGPW
jgi:hypothetical protein